MLFTMIYQNHITQAKYDNTSTSVQLTKHAQAFQYRMTVKSREGFFILNRACYTWPFIVCDHGFYVRAQKQKNSH